MADQTYSVAEAAKALGVSKNAVYNLVHRADFPAFRLAGKWKISKTMLGVWVEREAGKGSAEAQCPQWPPVEHEKSRPQF